MKRTFLVKKDPTIEAQDNWLIMDYRQYAAWRETDEGKKRKIVFGKFEACSDDDSIIFMECNEKVSKGACGHEWETSVKARSKGEKCPICSGARVIEGINDLATLKPLLAQEWSKKNKLKPTEVSVASHKKIIWKCKHGHEWEASVKSRTINGTGCPYCSHNKVLAGCENGTVYTVEGNSGDTCRTKTYPVGSSVIYGYGIPAY